MAKVAAQGLVSSNALHFGGGISKVGTAVKRKTPSELRGEQLKRKNVVELVDESPAPEHGSLKPEDSFASSAVTRDGVLQPCKTAEKCSENTFRSVTDLSSGGEKISGLEIVDLDRALKGLVANELPSFSSLVSDFSDRKGDGILGNLGSEFHMPGQKIPLDFTLKTSMRVMSSSSVNW
ncbi:hypothetical protein U1Q18_013918 [Sarracenia purpurea var. burkii]